MIVDLSTKRIQNLTDKGMDHLEAGRYLETHQAAAELEDAKGPLAFYLAAEAFARRNDVKSAVARMRRGVLISPTFWLNWFYLGIYLGRLNKHEEALAAYHQALLCPLVDADMVHMNMAIQAIECRNYETALSHLDSVEGGSSRWCIDGSRVLALEGIGRIAEAAALAEQFLKDRPEGDEDYEKRVGFIAAALARIRLQQGSRADEVRSFLINCLDEYGCSRPVLSEITRLRELRYSEEAKLYRFAIHAVLPVGHPWYREVPGYCVVYDVVSDSESLALEMINEFESAAGVESVEVLEIKIGEDKPEEPMGVFWISQRILY